MAHDHLLGIVCPIDPRKSLEQNIRDAAKLYHSMHGMYVTECVVHPAQLVDEHLTDVDGITVREGYSVDVKHFWLGHPQANPPQRRT